MNWADELILEYTAGRQGLNTQIDKLGDSEADAIDRTLLNSMREDMTYVIDWLEYGRQPGIYRGTEIRSIYQIQYMEDMDLIPDITNHIAEERDELYLEEFEREVLAKLFVKLSRRERQCFIMHVGQRKSMSEVAEKLGISKSTVQEYLERTREKVASVVQG